MCEYLPTAQQIDLIKTDESALIIAGPGTGKTRTLVARYISLLTERMPLRSIVAITFTKKAAREMRNRIREEVRYFLESSDLRGEDLTYWRGR